MSVHDDASAQRDLVATLERFQGDARAALGLRATDDAAAARRVFMSLCKVYHPAKFARFGPATVKLSNEVCLAIRRAYETVAAQTAVPVPIGPSASGPVPRPAGSSSRSVPRCWSSDRPAA